MFKGFQPKIDTRTTGDGSEGRAEARGRWEINKELTSDNSHTMARRKEAKKREQEMKGLNLSNNFQEEIGLEQRIGTHSHTRGDRDSVFSVE